MKKSELKFKMALLTPERAGAIVAALADVGINHKAEIAAFANYIRVTDGLIYVIDWAENFIAAEEPEVTYHQALDLIAQVESEPKKDGEFVDFDVDANGVFEATWGFGVKREWAFWPHVAKVESISNLDLIFAGWVWEDKNGRFVSAHRQGIYAYGQLVTCAGDWEKPAQPIAVRFWRKNK